MIARSHLVVIRACFWEVLYGGDEFYLREAVVMVGVVYRLILFLILFLTGGQLHSMIVVEIVMMMITTIEIMMWQP